MKRVGRQGGTEQVAEPRRGLGNNLSLWGAGEKG